MPNQMFNKLQSDNNIPTPQHNSSQAMVNYMWHISHSLLLVTVVADASVHFPKRMETF